MTAIHVYFVTAGIIATAAVAVGIFWWLAIAAIGYYLRRRDAHYLDRNRQRELR